MKETPTGLTGNPITFINSAMLDKRSEHSPPRPGRSKLWNLAGSCHCLIIGTCLTLTEVRAIAKRCQYDINGHSEYELHQLFVGEASHENSQIARQLQKHLDKKFRAEIKQVKLAASESELLDHWNAFHDTGKIAHALWAIATHPCCTTAVLQTLYGEIHMMSHLSGASVHQKAAELPAIKHEVEVLRNKLSAQRLTFGNKIKAYRYEVIRLENLNQKLRNESENKDLRPADGEQFLNKEDSDHIRCMLRESNQLLRTNRSQLYEARELADERQRQIEEHQHDIDKLEQLVSYLVSKDDSKNNKSINEDISNTECNNSLDGKCVLLLGGMPSQCKHFRAFVESNNGDFLHHDGGVESSYSQIDNLVRQADAVFCPVEQVSHSAMNRAKKLCKKSETPLVFLPKSSLSAFVSGIRTIQ